jgi:hypothetical protein
MTFTAAIFAKLVITQHGHVKIFVRNFTSIGREMRKLGGINLFPNVSKVWLYGSKKIVKNPHTEFHENQSMSFISDMKSRMDGWMGVAFMQSLFIL